MCDRISDEIVDLVFREAKKTGMDPARCALPARRWPRPTA
ncbi:MAG: S-adenosylmethionine synthetase N-terminal domain-containing protein [Opitutus sp.]|nr:S-adenosylmethionine synthetase N-terminal domain-containing protein [Opitutus sp.]